MSYQLVARGHHKDCVTRIFNNCWQCNGRFDMGICDKGDECDRQRPPYSGCSSECNVKKRFDEFKIPPAVAEDFWIIEREFWSGKE